ncbi:hypothetical protein BGP75_02725 [Motiliproteus sp. MSK22-1]|nr:hypothetical protein BGP75_02725 [Motiliproteus sp. MSK22-1]
MSVLAKIKTGGTVFDHLKNTMLYPYIEYMNKQDANNGHNQSKSWRALENFNHQKQQSPAFDCKAVKYWCPEALNCNEPSHRHENF